MNVTNTIREKNDLMSFPSLCRKTCVILVWITVLYSLVIQYMFFAVRNGMMFLGLAVLAAFLLAQTGEGFSLKDVFTQESAWMPHSTAPDARKASLRTRSFAPVSAEKSNPAIQAAAAVIPAAAPIPIQIPALPCPPARLIPSARILPGSAPFPRRRKGRNGRGRPPAGKAGHWNSHALPRGCR